MDNYHQPMQEMTEEIPLPENIEAEQAVLGVLFVNSESAVDEVMDKLQGNEFTTIFHRRIFKAAQEVKNNNQAVDLVTVSEQLRAKGWLEQQTISYLAKMANSIPIANNIEYYIGIVKKIYAQRQLIEDLKEQLAQARTTAEPNEVIAATQSRLEEIADQTEVKKGFRTLGQILPDVFEDLEKKFTNQDNASTTGVSSGFRDLDQMTSGFQKSDFIVIGARPSVGKTALALNVANHAAEETATMNKVNKTDEVVAVFSLEMSEKQLVSRMICAEGNVDATKFRTGHLVESDWEKITMAISKLSDLPLVIDDTPALSVAEIRSKCRKLKRERGLRMILIDYLQLVSGRGKSGESRQEEVSHISRTLKQIARELEVPVIALSQLSRGVEQRQDKRPMMSDLRESGSIEQDADIVSFLYRDDYYDKESEKKNLIEVIIAKQRNGPTGTVELVFLKQFNKFVNLDRSHQESTKQESWWEVLGVSKKASPQEVEKAYRELSKKYHPDKGGSNELMTKINRAVAEARHV